MYRVCFVPCFFCFLVLGGITDYVLLGRKFSVAPIVVATIHSRQNVFLGVGCQHLGIGIG